MQYNISRYSSNVWLTSVFFAPLMFLGIIFSEQDISHSSIGELLYQGLYLYLILVVVEILSSFVTWIFFRETIRALIKYSVDVDIRKWLIFATGILLTAGTCIIIFLPLGLFKGDDGYSMTYLMLCNCACIGWGTVHYKLKPVAT